MIPAPFFLSYSGFPVRSIHHKGTEFAEFGEFLNQEPFTPRPPRLRGAISEPCLKEKPEEPFFKNATVSLCHTRGGSGSRRQGETESLSARNLTSPTHN